MSDPKAKILKTLKRHKRAIEALRQAAQLKQWAIHGVGDEGHPVDAFIVGRPDVVLYLKELYEKDLEKTQEKPKEGAENNG